MEDNNLVRIIIVDISKQLASEVYDEIITTVDDATSFVSKYTDVGKYRVITV